MLKDVGVYIKELRDAQGITQQALADAAGASLRTESRWELDGVKFWSNELVAAIQHLGGSLGDVARIIAAETDGEAIARQLAAARLIAQADELLATGFEGQSADDVLLTMRALRDRPGLLEMVKAMIAVQDRQDAAAQKTEP